MEPSAQAIADHEGCRACIANDAHRAVCLLSLGTAPRGRRETGFSFLWTMLLCVLNQACLATVPSAPSSRDSSVVVTLPGCDKASSVERLGPLDSRPHILVAAPVVGIAGGSESRFEGELFDALSLIASGTPSELDVSPRDGTRIVRLLCSVRSRRQAREVLKKWDADAILWGQRRADNIRLTVSLGAWRSDPKWAPRELDPFWLGPLPDPHVILSERNLTNPRCAAGVLWLTHLAREVEEPNHAQSSEIATLASIVYHACSDPAPDASLWSVASFLTGILLPGEYDFRAKRYGNAALAGLPSWSVEAGIVLTNMGIAQLNNENFGQAEFLLLRARSILGAAEHRSRSAFVSLALGLLNMERAQYARAEWYLGSAIAQGSIARETTRFVQSWTIALARAQLAQGKLQEAENSLLQFVDTLADSDARALTAANEELGNVKLQQADFAVAERYFRLALEGYQSNSDYTPYRVERQLALAIASASGWTDSASGLVVIHSDGSSRFKLGDWIRMCNQKVVVDRRSFATLLDRASSEAMLVSVLRRGDVVEIEALRNELTEIRVE